MHKIKIYIIYFLSGKLPVNFVPFADLYVCVCVWLCLYMNEKESRRGEGGGVDAEWATGRVCHRMCIY